jgi:hypothetical protein
MARSVGVSADPDPGDALIASALCRSGGSFLDAVAYARYVNSNRLELVFGRSLYDDTTPSTHEQWKNMSRGTYAVAQKVRHE